MKIYSTFLAIATSLLISACGGGGNESTVPVKSIQASTPSYSTDDLYQFFAVAFGAAPGVTYMGQLLDAANAGMSIKEIVNVFTTKDQFTSVYPLTLTNAEFATRLSANVIGLSATDQAKQNAVTDIVNALAAPGWTRGDVIFAVFTNLANKSPTDTEWGGTSKQMKNQVVFARYYTEVMKGDTTTVDTLQRVIRSVTATTDVVSGIEAAILASLNTAPVANAGVAQNVVAGSVVTLDGSASSDANGDPLTYAWTITSKPAGSTAALSSTTSAKPTFTADVAGTYVASLVVNDGKVSSSAATSNITTVAPVLTLLSVSSGFFGGSDTVVLMPFSTTSSASASIQCVGSGCATAYDVDTYRLRASGQSYTITNLRATNLTGGSSIVPLFSGLSNGQTIADGSTVTFKLQSPFTRGSTVNLRYAFTVQETGATFEYTVQLRTN